MMRSAGPTCIALFALLSCSNGQPQDRKPASDAATTRPVDVPVQVESASGDQSDQSDQPVPSEVVIGRKGAVVIPNLCRYDDLGKELTAARDLWRGTGINSYSMTIQRASFHQLAAWPNSRPLKLVVRDGHATGNLPRVDPAWLQSVTVDGLFDFIETEAAKHPDCLNVSFDPTFGFPTSIRIDPVFGGADDELEYSISEFGS
jgi:hypothetical protein